MQTNLEQKRTQLLMFVNQLSQDPEFKFCIDFSYFSFGMFDAPYIMNGMIPTLSEIKETIKTKKKLSFKSIFNDLRRIFQGISDYVLSSDPLQLLCEKGIKKVNEFEHILMHRNCFVQEDSGSQTRSFRYSSKSSSGKPLQFFKQIQMAFHLINNNSNQQMIRQIGERYHILEETQEQYILDLGKSNAWASLVAKVYQEK